MANASLIEPTVLVTDWLLLSNIMERVTSQRAKLWGIYDYQSRVVNLRPIQESLP